MSDIAVQSLGFKIYHAFFKILKPFTNSHMIITDFRENKMKIRGIINNKIRSQLFSVRLFPELSGRGCSPVNVSCWR